MFSKYKIEIPQNSEQCEKVLKKLEKMTEKFEKQKEKRRLFLESEIKKKEEQIQNQ